MPSFLDLLAERPVLLADGATGTNYQNMGIEPGVAPEEWVIDDLFKRYAAVGAVLVTYHGGEGFRVRRKKAKKRTAKARRRAR